MTHAQEHSAPHVHLSLTKDEVAALDAILVRGEKFSHHESDAQKAVAAKIHEAAK